MTLLVVVDCPWAQLVGALLLKFLACGVRLGWQVRPPLVAKEMVAEAGVGALDRAFD